MSTEIRDEAEFHERVEVQLENIELLSQPESFIPTANLSPEAEPGNFTSINTFPMREPIFDHGTIGSISETFSAQFHVHKVTANGDITMAITFPPEATLSQFMVIEIKMDGVGGHTITLPPEVTPTIPIDTAANAITRFRMRTVDGGTVWFADLLGLQSGTSFIGFTADADLNMGAFDIKSTIDPIASGNAFKIIFDAHLDSDTFISSSTVTIDRINVFNNAVNTVAFTTTGILMATTADINLNTSDLLNVGFLQFQGTVPASGSIRLPSGVAGSIGWESTPAGFDGELYFDNDFNQFVDTGQAHKFWVGGSQISEFATGLNMMGNDITSVGKISVDSTTTEAGFFDAGHTGDPSSATAGDMYFNTTSNEYRSFNGATWDVMSSTGGANTALSNLAAVAINTNLLADTDQIRDLGSPSFYWDEVFTRTVIFNLANKPVDATETGIGASTTELWLNQTAAGNTIAFRWDNVIGYDFARTIFSTQNPVLLWQLVNGATNTFGIQDSASLMDFTLSVYDHFRFTGNNHTRMELVGIGFTTAGLNDDEILFDSSTSTASDIAGQIHFVAHTDTAANFDIVKIVALNEVPTNATRSGLLEIRLSQSGTENNLFMDLSGFNNKINFRKVLDMNNNKIDDIGETTITDLTPATGVAGDFLMMVDATDGLMKKVDAADFVGGGGGSTFADNVFEIFDDITPSKKITFNATLLDASAVILMSYEAGAGRTYTFPNISGEIGMLGGVQTFGGAKTFNSFVCADATPVFVDGSIPVVDIVGTAVNLNTAQTLTATKTWDNGLANAILLKSGGKLEFETAGGSTTNLEIHGGTSLRDPGDLTIVNRDGIEIDLNTGAVPDTEVFQIGDGSANPWFILDDNAVRFNTTETGANAYDMILSRDIIPSGGDPIMAIFGESKISASVRHKFGFLQIDTITVSSTPATNVGRIRIGAVSNNVLNSGIIIDGVGGSSATALNFYNTQTPVARQTVSGSRSGNVALANLLIALNDLGLINNNTT